MPTNIEDYIKFIAAGSLFFGLFMIVFTLVAIALWIAAVVHCIKYRHDKDRLLWVIITAFGGPIGCALYYAMGRLPPTHPVSGRSNKSSDTAKFNMAVCPMDHSAIHDEKRRVQAISDSLSKSVRSKR
jgi:alpha/beta superfamily hydrolase